ncbi:MAG: hypothetical protein H7Z42_03320 [Roseiflexaceae bacterium]|nr:hypothetical protein [Roseiflexaceae bacterium]
MSNHRSALIRVSSLASLVLCIALAGLAIIPPQAAQAEGSFSVFPALSEGNGARANIEWRSSKYGPLLFRRTLLRVYAREGEYILTASSAVAAPQSGSDPASRGDVLIYAPNNAVSGAVGRETIPASPSFSCLQQRVQTGNAQQGRISSRTQELAGPDTIINTTPLTPGRAAPNAYLPCFYRVPTAGTYSVVFYGPRGDNSDVEPDITGQIGEDTQNFDSRQRTSITAWDVSVRGQLADRATDQAGRLYTYYLTANTGANGRPVNSSMYVVTSDGFRYRVTSNGSDPYGWVSYANSRGFLDGDAPLYRNVLAVPTLANQDQNQLMQLQGGATLADPEFPMFFSPPADETLASLGIPLVPDVPRIEQFAFESPLGGDTTIEGQGGTFSFTTTISGVYELVVSRDGVDFDPTNLRNRVLRGTAQQPGLVSIVWDGKDAQGFNFPISDVYRARMEIHGGEVHFPSLDVENSINGGPTIEMLNPPGADCYAFVHPDGNRRCTGAFYDDRGYRTNAGVLVGTAVNGSLCENSTGNPPPVLFSPTDDAYDSAGPDRRYGFARGGNTDFSVCASDGGFGDKKGLDEWTYYPSNELFVPLQIVGPLAIQLTSFTAQAGAQGTNLRWTTAAERDSAFFHILRSSDQNIANASRLTTQEIVARGGPTAGAEYQWLDGSVQPGSTYYYWLQETETSGNVRTYGPAQAARPQASLGSRVYVPLVRR